MLRAADEVRGDAGLRVEALASSPCRGRARPRRSGRCRARRRSADGRRSCGSPPASAGRRAAPCRRCRAPRRSSASRARRRPAPDATSTCSRGRRCRACRFARAGSRRARSRRGWPRSAGSPPTAPSPRVMMSGLRSNVCEPNMLPVRPKPQITSSTTNRMSYFLQDRLDAIEIGRRRHDDAARAHHRLGEERGDRVGTLAQDQLPRGCRQAARRTPPRSRPAARRDSSTGNRCAGCARSAGRNRRARTRARSGSPRRSSRRGTRAAAR